MRPIEHTRFFLPALLLLILWPGSATATETPADEVLQDFKVDGQFMWVMDGKSRMDAEIFFSERAVAYLVMAEDLASPLMISIRTRAVESVDLTKVRKEDDGTMDILADAELTPVTTFKLQEQQVVFTIDGKSAGLKPRPWLLGRHTGSRLKEHNPEYAFRAGQYIPVPEDVAALKGISLDVRIRVYFGSWCPHCKEIVPKILRLADELDGSTIRFEYYGLSKPIGQDLESRKVNIRSVPAVIIYVDGQEVHRLDGPPLLVPEKALQGLVGMANGSGS